MSGALVTLKKELLSYCCSPVSYLIAVLFYLWRGFEVTTTVQGFAAYQADADLFPSACYGFMSTFFVTLLVPGVLTMRCFAEERRTGSIEMLMTAPVRDLGIVLGKWFAAVVFYLLLWLPTIVLLWALQGGWFLGTGLAFGPVFSAYLGLFLLAAMLMAFGCFASSLTDNLLLAAIVSIAFNFGLLRLPEFLRNELGSVANNVYVADLLQKLDVLGNFGQWFARGLIDTSQIWFYAGGTAFFLFLTVLSFSARRLEGAGRQLRWLGSWLHLLLAGLLMLCVWALLAWVGSRPALRTLVDLSPGQRASIDPVTEDLLLELGKQDVKVEFHTFFLATAGQPQDEVQLQMQRILGRLRELTSILLRQYRFRGGDAVQVIEHDQYTNIARAREAAQKFGVTESDVVVVAVTQPGRPPRHRKLTLEGDLGVIDTPALNPSGSPMQRSPVPVLKDYKGEEALSSALKSLLVQGTPTAYFLHGLTRDNLRGAGQADYGNLLQALEASGFDVQELDLTRTSAVPKNASVVALIEPRGELSTTEVRALHDYVLRGGRLCLNYSWSAIADHNTDGGELGKLLGFQVGSAPVLHLIKAPNLPDVRGIDNDPRVRTLDLEVNPNHKITRRIWLGRQILQLVDARALGVPDAMPPGVRREPLLRTGADGWLGVRTASGELDLRAPRVPNAIGSFEVGTVIEVDGPVAGADGNKPTGIVVVVSGEFCNNHDMPLNGVLALNIFNWLAQREVLLDIKGSRYVARHLQIVPQQLQAIRWFLIGGVPAGFLGLGLLVFWRRRRV